MAYMPPETGAVPRQLHPIDALGAAWNTFKNHVGLCLGAAAILFVVIVVGEMIPFVNLLFGILVAPALVAGGARFVVRLAQGEHPTIESLFDGFKRWATVTGVYWLQAAGVLLILSPLLVTIITAVGLEAFSHPDQFTRGHNPFLVLPVLGAAAIFYPLAIWWMLRTWPATFLAMEPKGPGAVDALKGALAMTAGNTWRSLGMFALMLPLELAGLAALCVGIIPAMIVCYLQWAHGYLQLRGPAPSAPLAGETAPPAPTIV